MSKADPIQKDVIQCPLCSGVKIGWCEAYRGSFASCNSIYQCQSCQLIFAFKAPSKQELDHYYQNGLYYETVSEPFSQEFLRFSERLCESRVELLCATVGIPECSKFLDVGAGNAQYGVALKKQVNSVRYDVIESDNSARSQYGDWVDNLHEGWRDLNEDEYDFVVLNQILEHVDDPVTFISTLTSRLAKGGVMFIDVPHMDHRFKQEIGPHILFWNQKSIEKLIEISGLKLVFCNTAGMRIGPAARFFRTSSLWGRVTNLWAYADLFNSFMRRIGAPLEINTFQRFEADQYGGDRQWLRCIAKKEY